MPAMLHWKHPNFYAYFSTGCSFPNVYGDMLSTGCGGNGFTWVKKLTNIKLFFLFLLLSNL